MQTIMQYVRDEKGRRKGLMLARAHNGKVYVGTSVAAVSLGDEFLQKDAKSCANERIAKLIRGEKLIPVHSSMRKELANFTARAMKFFRTDNIEGPDAYTGVFEKGQQVIEPFSVNLR